MLAEPESISSGFKNIRIRSEENELDPEELQAIVDEHALVLFMKGTPENAQCGFSNRATQVMQSFGEPFASVDVLSDPKAIPSICAWSDFPTTCLKYSSTEN